MSDPMAVSRRLVAVFAADVEGYSRLMGADEVSTLKGPTERGAKAEQPSPRHHRADRRSSLLRTIMCIFLSRLSRSSP
jgi:hypothetical protein